MEVDGEIHVFFVVDYIWVVAVVEVLAVLAMDVVMVMVVVMVRVSVIDTTFYSLLGVSHGDDRFVIKKTRTNI